MRPLAILATVVTCAAATAASAQSLASASANSSSANSSSADPSSAGLSSTSLSLTDQAVTDGAPLPIQIQPGAARSGQEATLALLNNAAFAPRTGSSDVDPTSHLIDREAYQPGAGIVRWMTGQAPLATSADGGAVASLRVSVGGPLRTPPGVALALSRAQFDPDAYEVALTRDWPAALAVETAGFGLDVTPHAAVGMTSQGGSAEAGATIRLMQKDSFIKERLNALGVRDGSSFGDKGRWYLFAAASGRAVGFNMLRNPDGWDRAGLSTDTTSTLIGDTQVGVGWRKGDVQTSLGYIHREVKGQNMLFGIDPGSDSMVAFSLSIRPHF
jgi:hypothetical protein